MKQVGSAHPADSRQSATFSRTALEEKLLRAQVRHRELESRLEELKRRAHLTPPEQVEAAELKKHKLRAKDEIADIERALV